MAAGMLIAAGVFLGMLHSGAVEWNVGRAVAGADSAAQPEPEPSAEVEAPSLPPATPADTEAELASLQRQLEQARQQARQAATRLESQRDLYEQQLAAVSGPEPAAAAPAEASAGRQLDEALSDAREARRRLTVTQGQLAEARKEIEELRQSVSETSTSHARQRQQLAGELAEAEKEADRLRALLARETGELRRLHEQALADVRQARRQVGRLETLLAIRSADTQRAYLNALAPGASGLARRQLAARSANLTARLPAVREQVRSQPALELMDRLEVALLKLEFLDPDREAGRRAFREFLREQSFPEAIDEQLATGTLASDARQWLVEARMILAGAERAA
jgi:DNA repair exonuclease SbcCD ATPase subunit